MLQEGLPLPVQLRLGTIPSSKMVQDGVLPDCCSPGVKFVRVQLELDYSDLATKVEYVGQNPILHGNYYLQLLQGSVDLTNKHGLHYRLMSFLRATDLRTLTPPEVQRNIVDSIHQDGPYDFLALSFNLTSC
jgi:hypothetical protein